MANYNNINSMSDALTWAHDVMKNAHALNEKDLEPTGLTSQTLDMWIAYVEELRQTVIEYIKVSEDESATQQSITTALNHVFQSWRAVCKQGAEKEFNSNFFIRKNDANTIAEWCGRKDVTTARGKVFSTKEKTDFRRHVEILIGIRMTGNAVLTDEERDLITKYENAIRSIQHNERILTDAVQNGKVVKYGLRSQLKFAERDLEEEKAFLDGLGDRIDDDTKEAKLSKLRKIVSDCNKAVTAAETAKATAEGVRDDNKSAYDKAIALIKSVGGDK